MRQWWPVQCRVLLDIVHSAALSLTELTALLGAGDSPALLDVETVPAADRQLNTELRERERTDLSGVVGAGLAHSCWLTVVHSCLHCGSVKHSLPDLTEDLTRLQDLPEEKTCGTALVRLGRLGSRKKSRVITTITTNTRG